MVRTTNDWKKYEKILSKENCTVGPVYRWNFYCHRKRLEFNPGQGGIKTGSGRAFAGFSWAVGSRTQRPVYWLSYLARLRLKRI